MIAELHREQLVERFVRDVRMSRLLPRLIVIEHPEHLISVPQLLGHDAKHGHLHLIGRRFFECEAVLLNRSELGRGLRADDVARGVKHVANHLSGVFDARLSGHAAVIDRVGVEFADLRHQLKRRLRRVVLRPVVEEELHLREVFLLPRDESIVIARRNRFGGVSSQTVPPWSVLRENARAPGKHSLATVP